MHCVDKHFFAKCIVKLTIQKFLGKCNKGIVQCFSCNVIKFTHPNLVFHTEAETSEQPEF